MGWKVLSLNKKLCYQWNYPDGRRRPSDRAFDNWCLPQPILKSPDPLRSIVTSQLNPNIMHKPGIAWKICTKNFTVRWVPRILILDQKGVWKNILLEPFKQNDKEVLHRFISRWNLVSPLYYSERKEQWTMNCKD